MSTSAAGSGFNAAKIISVPPTTCTFPAGSGYKAAQKLRLKVQSQAAKIVTLQDRIRELEKENKSLKQKMISNFKEHKREVADLEQRLTEAQSTLSNLDKALSFGAWDDNIVTLSTPGPLWTLLGPA
jgi:septal ring factor EnvC (AmiA/AmiB activator)